jgi:hypothetical protein
MSLVFVLGNGLSRQTVDPAQLQELAPVYGCNALYRDFPPDVLVATDRPIAEHIQNSGYSVDHRFYTRKPIAGLGARPIPKEYWTFSSGPAAVGIAADAGHEAIYIIGFDMGPTEHNRFNNLYSDTEFYKSSAANPTYSGNWVRQLQHITKKYPNKRFIRVTGATTAAIANLDNIKNLTHLPIAQFLLRLNSKKDL